MTGPINQHVSEDVGMNIKKRTVGMNNKYYLLFMPTVLLVMGTVRSKETFVFNTRC